MATNRRARSPAGKAARRRAILEAAERRYEDAPLHLITMGDLAADVGLVKGSLYLYFRTREDVFLALLERHLADWFDELDSTLGGGTGRLTGARLVSLFTDTAVARPVLRRLLADLGGIEWNVPYENALRFGWRLVSRVTATGELLERRTRFLQSGDGVRLLVQVQALVIGLERQAERAPEVRRVLEAPGMDVLRLDFPGEFRTALGTLIAGLERTN